MTLQPSRPYPSPHPPLLFSKTPNPSILSSNATSFFLINRSFSPTNNKDNDNNHEDVENGKDSDEATVSNSAKIKMPTDPWMKGHVLFQPHEVLDLSKPTTRKEGEGRRRGDIGRERVREGERQERERDGREQLLHGLGPMIPPLTIGRDGEGLGGKRYKRIKKKKEKKKEKK